MAETMRTVTVFADWKPRSEFRLGLKDEDGKRTYRGNLVYCNPHLEIVEKPIPEDIGPTELLVEVRANGVCGSDVHMVESGTDGYVQYPGLVSYPHTLGHECAGEVVAAGEQAFNKITGIKFKVGEAVTFEEMWWCGDCKPCSDGYPNHCENLREIGFDIDGALARYVKVKARYVWGLEALMDIYDENDLFLVGSLTEPTSVSYNAIVERAGGIKPGENVVIFGGGPIGLACVAILKHMGATNIIVSEPSAKRRQLAKVIGATHVIDPLSEDHSVTEQVLDITKGVGAKLYIEAAGAFKATWPQLESCIWLANQINSVAVLIGRVDQKVPFNPEVFQVRRAQIVGCQGHSGHGTFQNVISLMSQGMNVLPMVTKKIGLEQVGQSLEELEKDKNEGKVTVIIND